MARRRTVGDLTWNTLNYTVLALFALICVYPFIWTAAASLSDPAQVVAGKVWLWPRGFTTIVYEVLLSYDQLWVSYSNTIIYVVTGTTLNVVLTMLAAYPLSRTWFPARGPVTGFIVFTMFFSGGMIPTFLVVKMLGMLNTMWAMIIPGAISAWELVMARTYLTANVPDEMIEAAAIDGANDLQTLWAVVLPLSVPVIAVITLFYAVGHWNDYFSALLYLRDPGLYPLQVFMRQMATLGGALQVMSGKTSSQRALIQYTIKYGTIIVGTLPIMLIYPFLQKYFVKGVMLGALKG